VVIDPGHGGGDPGVRSAAGLVEKDLVLAIAGRLKEQLEMNLGVKVLLTRTGDYEVSPVERAAMSNHNKATLFVSLHLGASASPTADAFEASWAEPRRGRGEDPPPPGTWRAWRGQNEPWREASRATAASLQGALARWLSREPAEPRPADWAVLSGVGCPAVLVELGCLTNPDRERSLGEKAFLDELARVLYGALAGAMGVEGG
jgi:N-acetylmuramoyl-L-alanine amidase